MPLSLISRPTKRKLKDVGLSCFFTNLNFFRLTPEPGVKIIFFSFILNLFFMKNASVLFWQKIKPE